MVTEAVFMSASSTNAFIDVMGSNFRDIERDIELASGRQRIAAATGGSADVHVQMEHLIEFYNALSQLHEQLYEFSSTLLARADALGSIDAGGKVAGISTAWTEITAGIGARSAQASMAANLRAVDAAVMKYMAALHKNAQDYAEREQIAITGLDKAAGTHTAHKHKKGAGHHGTSGKGHGTAKGAQVQGGSGQVLQGSEQVLQAPSSDTTAHGGLVLGG